MDKKVQIPTARTDLGRFRFKLRLLLLHLSERAAMPKTGLGCEPVVGSLTASRKREYKVSNRVHEGKRPLYAIAFNFIDARYYDVFATVGGNRVRFLRPAPT